jgi:hypothetical protein
MEQCCAYEGMYLLCELMLHSTSLPLSLSHEETYQPTSMYLHYSTILLYYTILYYTILHYTILHYTNHTILYSIIGEKVGSRFEGVGTYQTERGIYLRIYIYMCVYVYICIYMYICIPISMHTRRLINDISISVWHYLNLYLMLSLPLSLSMDDAQASISDLSSTVCFTARALCMWKVSLGWARLY